MELHYLKETAYDKLLNNVSANKAKYHQSENWLKEYFANKEYYAKSSIIVGSVQLETSEQNESLQDLINVRLLHSAMKNLTPLQAHNKYLWTYLSHVTFRDYIVKRWLMRPREATYKTRYFVTNSNSLTDNAVSRLWWYGYVTYDENGNDPYYLTKILLINQTVCTDLIDASFSRNPSITKGVLNGLKNVIHDKGTSAGISMPFRRCIKYLRRYGAVTCLDTLDTYDIEELTYNYLINTI